MRLFLRLLMIAGFLMLPIGPLLRVSNEGFGGPPGPIEASMRWQQLSYALIPTGAAIVIAAGIGLVAIDRKHPRSV